MEVVALKRQNQFEYLILMAREDVCVKIDKLMSGGYRRAASM